MEQEVRDELWLLYDCVNCVNSLSVPHLTHTLLKSHETKDEYTWVKSQANLFLSNLTDRHDWQVNRQETQISKADQHKESTSFLGH